MSIEDRRRFLRLAAHAAGATLAAEAFPPAIARALEIPAHDRTGTIRDVRHVVILMQENRSFDHYFGTLPGVRGFGDRFTIPLPDGRRVWEQSNGQRTVLPYHLDSTRGNAQRVTGTPHTWPDAQGAWDHGRLTSWPQFKHDQSMGYYTAAELGFQFALAEAFTLCDAYHCSVHGGTNPNRLFLWTGTHGPGGGGGVASLTNEWCEPGPASEGFEWTTYPERLQAAGVSWKVYQNLPDNFNDNPLAGFRRYREALAKAATRVAQSPSMPGAVMPQQAMGEPYSDASEALSPLLKGVSNTMPDGGFLESFREDVRRDRLPSVSWIIAPEAYSEHPGPSSPVQGAWYVQEVLNALTARPEVWSRTALLVNFDENDGFFDHVPPPAPPSVDDAGRVHGLSTCDVSLERFTHDKAPGATDEPPADGRPYGMGPRVPMWVISPWSRGGWVNSQVFDHTSVIRFLEARFGVREPNITPWRRAVAGDLTSAFNFRSPNTEALPSWPRLQRSAADLQRTRQEQLAPVAVPSAAEQVAPRQARGVRASRALPYELHVSGRADRAARRMVLEFRNTGTAGAVFHVYDCRHLQRMPRRYTVQAGKSLQDHWELSEPAGQYDLWILGPNGFHRSFRGLLPEDAGVTSGTDSGAGMETEVSYDVRRRSLKLTIFNDGSSVAQVQLRANAYRGDGPWTFRIGARDRVKHVLSVADSGNWYDFSVVADSFERRFAGRLETGFSSISDPEMGG